MEKEIGMIVVGPGLGHVLALKAGYCVAALQKCLFPLDTEGFKMAGREGMERKSSSEE